jgi:hypothetical protein
MQENIIYRADRGKIKMYALFPRVRIAFCECNNVLCITSSGTSVRQDIRHRVCRKLSSREVRRRFSVERLQEDIHHSAYRKIFSIEDRGRHSAQRLQEDIQHRGYRMIFSMEDTGRYSAWKIQNIFSKEVTGIY